MSIHSVKRSSSSRGEIIYYATLLVPPMHIFANFQNLWWLSICIDKILPSSPQAFIVSFIYISDLFPTVTRVTGCNIGAFASHVGFFCATFITNVLVKWAWWLPNLIFGICGLLAALLVCLLPETRGLSLCETVQDVEDRAAGLKNRKNKESKQVDQVEENKQA
ncbi:unnamed protein product, partial [Meganyctiphanes norvegica]